MPFYAVIDTNVLVSAFLSNNDDSATVKVMEKVLAGEIVPVFNFEIMKEYCEVLKRKKFRFNIELINAILSYLSDFGLMINAMPTNFILPDIKDVPFYEVVLEKRKTNDAFLVTGNKKHFPIAPYIVSPREMLNIINQQVK